jgi:hypothetical protein
MNKGLEVRSNGRNLLHPRTLRSNIGDEADRAEADAWSLDASIWRPRAAVPTIGQCINGGLGSREPAA